MIDFEKGILHPGSWGKIIACMHRARQGETLTLAFLGGSITQGSLASTPESCYAARVFQWWQESFPQAKFHFINAGIGGTDSHFGVARVEEDVLQYRPDFLLTEFSVNDEDTPHFQETYEGLVRRILSREDGPALMLMHNVCYDTGSNAESQHLPVARHYDIPCVSMKPSIYAQVAAGNLPNREITPDDLHPNDAGHALVAQQIIRLLEKIRASDIGAQGESLPLPPPLTENRYQNAVRYRNHNCQPRLSGFVADPEPQEHITQTFRKGFIAWNPGDSLEFTLEGTAFAVQYRKSVTQPAPVALAWVDGGEPVVLDGNFDQTWGDCTYLQPLCRDLTPGSHTVTVKLTQTGEKAVVPFYLISVIAAP